MPRPDRAKAAKAGKASNDRAAKAASIQKAGVARERRRNLLIFGSAAAVIVAIVAAVTFAIIRDSPALVELSDVEVFENQAAQHTGDPVEYEQIPPAGGEHHPAWWNCGVYPEPVPDEHAVHSIEHGAVWLTYRPDLPADQVAVLTELGEQDFMLVSPHPDQESPVVATTWDHQLSLDTADELTLRAFIREYKQGPTTPELGAACTGGTVTDLVDRS